MKANLGSLYRRKKKRADGSVQVLPTWWIKFRRGGQVFRESTGETDENKARNYLARRIGEVASGAFRGFAVERITVGELIGDVERDHELNGRRSLDIMRMRIEKHVRPFFGKIRAADFGTDHVNLYVARRKRAGAANATINRELAIVRRAFKLAAEHDPPKVARVPRVKELEENNARAGFLEHSEYIAMRDALPEELRLLFVIGYYTGVRRGELLGLQWRQVDLAAGRIRLEVGSTKNGEGRLLPVYGEMAEWLAMAAAIRDAKCPGCAWVFHRDGKRILDFRKAWDTARAVAGLPELLVHDLRRSAARNMLRAGIPEKTVMEIIGHKTRAMLDRYNITNDRDLTMAGARMEAYLGTLSGTLTAEPAKSSKPKKSASRVN